MIYLVSGVGFVAVYAFKSGIFQKDRVAESAKKIFSKADEWARIKLGWLDPVLRERVRTKIAHYTELPAGDRPFMKKVMNLYASTLTVEAKDALIQNKRDREPDALHLVMNLSWRALLFSPDLVTENSSPAYLRSFHGNANAWRELESLRKEFQVLSLHDQEVLLDHPDPEDVARMPITEKAKEVYRGIRAIASRHHQGNVAYNRCIEEICQKDEERGRSTEVSGFTQTSENYNLLLFFLRGNYVQLKRKIESFSHLPTNSPSELIRELLKRHQSTLPQDQTTGYREEMKENQLFSRKLVLQLCLRALLCHQNENLKLKAAMPFFKERDMRDIEELKKAYRQLPMIDQYYLLSNVIPPKVQSRPRALENVLNEMEEIVHGAMECNRTELERLVDRLVV